MDDLILANRIDRPFHVQNGRQIARRGDGTWLLAYDGDGDSPTIYLRISSKAVPLTEDDLSAPIPLAGGSESVLSASDTDSADQISIVVDANDRLHAVWCNPSDESLLYAQCSLAGVDVFKALSDSGGWCGADGCTRGSERIDIPGGGLGEAGGYSCFGKQDFSGISGKQRREGRDPPGAAGVRAAGR